jgi:hypothetical protein
MSRRLSAKTDSQLEFNPITIVPIASTSKTTVPAALGITTLLKQMEAGTKSTAKRMTALNTLDEAIRTNGGTYYFSELLNSGFLYHVRGWFELSLQNRSSSNEKLFRSHLLHLIQTMRSQITLQHVRESRLNRALLRCATSADDPISTRHIAADLLRNFSALLALPLEPLTDLPPAPSVQVPKRPKVRSALPANKSD